MQCQGQPIKMPRSTNQNVKVNQSKCQGQPIKDFITTDEEELASKICGINISNVRLFVCLFVRLYKGTENSIKNKVSRNPIVRVCFGVCCDFACLSICTFSTLHAGFPFRVLLCFFDIGEVVVGH